MLTILFTETFREVHVVWPTSIDDGLVDRVKPDTMLTEMDERLRHLTVDGGFAVAVHARGRFGAELSGVSRRGSPRMPRP